MDIPSFYEIRVEGRLSDRWSEWFDGLEMHTNTNDETILSGSFVDQAALFGTLTKIQALNIILISVTRLSLQSKKS